MATLPLVLLAFKIRALKDSVRQGLRLTQNQQLNTSLLPVSRWLVSEMLEEVDDLAPRFFSVVDNHAVALLAGKVTHVHEAILSVNGGVSPQIVSLVHTVGGFHHNLVTGFINLG
jgi:hypothetical protein